MVRKLLRELQGFLVLGAALAIIVVLLLNNARPQVTHSLPAGTPQLSPTEANPNTVGQIIAAANNSTPLLPTTTLDSLSPRTPSPTAVLVQNSDALIGSGLPTPTRVVPLGPTDIPPTAAAAPTGPIVVANPNPRSGQYSPPPELAPLSMDPRDHFWFRRPVDASANSTELFYYTYGADGPGNLWRVHHGLDMPNPIGKEVRAAGDGMVIWAGDNYTWTLPSGKVDRAYTYGNVVIIRHNFGYQGKPLYTVYAHLQLILPYITVNTPVKMGDVIGLSGESGVVSGPHVHFEVRVEENSYYATRNPILWMTPYEGHGVVAGRLLYSNGQPVEDENVTLSQGGRVLDTTTTYVNPRRPDRETWNVNSDDGWRETFVIGDVPAGEYTIAMSANGIRFTQQIVVRPGTTTFVDMGQVPVGPASN
jgi:murein DD-endopeptidase MepM/ murein hydrolase activator NlpD